jgi:hypothetical protein
MPGGGIAICLIGSDNKWQDKALTIIEKVVQNQITFYVNESGSKDPKAWVWYWHVVDNCDLIIVDTASCTEHEIRMALGLCKLDNPVVFYVKDGNDEFVALLKAIDVPCFADLDNLPIILEAIFGG